MKDPNEKAQRCRGGRRGDEQGMVRNGAWTDWVGSNSRAWLSFGVQIFVVESEQTNRQKDQVKMSHAQEMQ